MTKAEDVIPALAKAIRGAVSQRHWGATLGVTKDVVSRTESGSRLNKPYLKKLARMSGADARRLRALIEEVPENRGTWIKRRTIAKIAAKVARRRGVNTVAWGDSDVLEEIASKAKVAAPSPPERWRMVLDGLRRDRALWQKSTIKGTDRRGRPCRVRSFQLKEPNE